MHYPVPGLEKGLVFLSEKGGHRFSNVLTKPLARCAEGAHVNKHVTAHTMRRTFNNLARQAAGAGADPSISGALGAEPQHQVVRN